MRKFVCVGVSNSSMSMSRILNILLSCLQSLGAQNTKFNSLTTRFSLVTKYSSHKFFIEPNVIQKSIFSWRIRNKAMSLFLCREQIAPHFVKTKTCKTNRGCPMIFYNLRDCVKLFIKFFCRLFLKIFWLFPIKKGRCQKVQEDYWWWLLRAYVQTDGLEQRILL